MDINDLRPGDVLLFSGEKGSYISEVIMFLTGAPVSHAALAYDPSSSIIEETPPAVQTNPAEKRFVDRKITVMRLEPAQPNYDPVLTAARGYLNNQEPYSFANLYLVGLLLIYKKFTPDTLKQKIIINFLKKITADIITYYNKHQYPGKLPMVCSQFVYQCFDDAGQGYALHVKDGVLAAEKGGPAQQSLLDQAISRVRNDTSTDFRDTLRAQAGKTLAAPTPVEESEEELAKALLQALQSPSALTAVAEVPLEDELVLAIQDFSQAITMARTGIEAPADELLQANSLRMPSASMALLKAEEAYFVSPADLLLHCRNLNKVGEIGS